ncbi:zinc finger protein 260-like [Sabethes cyaneus]|uniref:zinc finger protein 260-like n=1 Tax=Sabethes cyaneus TaxID=53552 RepID=UPI00237DC020|nr:zinc finger protein 260-like [Sabethes cyaneus]
MASFCRCCLVEEEDMLYLFTVLSEFESPASELISNCCGITILESDCFTKDICKNCLKELVSAARFRRLCLQTESTLQEKLDLKDPLTVHSVGPDQLQTADDLIAEKSTEAIIKIEGHGNQLEIEDFVVENSFEETEIVECILRDSSAEVVTVEQTPIKSNQNNLTEKQSTGEAGIAQVESGRASDCCMFECEFCNKGFMNKSHFTQHRCIHTGERPHECDICGKAFAQKSDVQQHLQCHTGDSFRFSCGACGKKFQYKINLDVHVCVHTGERPYKCKICHKEYAHNGTLRYHLRKHHKICDRLKLSEESSNLRDPSEENEINCDRKLKEEPISTENDTKNKRTRKDRDPRPHKCEFCGKGFINSNHLVQHRRIHTGEKPHECKTCGKAYAQKSHLTAHMRHHTGDYNFKCDQCGKGFLYSAELATHSRSHTGERPHKCEICRKDFVQKSALTQHLRSHSGERLHQCELCGKGFVRPGHLAQHMSMHTGQRMFKCTVCGKEFSRNGYLTQHMLIHGGELNHKCALCGKAFLSKSYLSQHMRFHSDSRPYKCEGCGKGFINRCHLKRHMRTHTGEQMA